MSRLGANSACSGRYLGVVPLRIGRSSGLDCGEHQHEDSQGGQSKYRGLGNLDIVHDLSIDAVDRVAVREVENGAAGGKSECVKKVGVCLQGEDLAESSGELGERGKLKFDGEGGVDGHVEDRRRDIRVSVESCEQSGCLEGWSTGVIGRL